MDEPMIYISRDRVQRLIDYVVADQEFSQMSTWAGIWSDDAVKRAAVNLQYVGREERRRDARRAITLTDLDPLPKPIRITAIRSEDV